VVDPRLEEMHLSEDHLVVELLQLAEEGGNEGESFSVVGIVDVSTPTISTQPWGRKVGTHNPTSRVSRFCFRKIRFSDLAQSTFSLVASMTVALLSGMELKKSRSVRTTS
jgi:hypothetical protein